MQTSQLQVILDDMPGRDYTFDKLPHVVMQAYIDDDAFVIVTDRHTYRKKISVAEEYLKSWTLITNGHQISNPKSKSAEVAPPATTTPAPMAMEEDKNLANDLVAILRDSIKQVKDSPGYIPQATNINENVKTIIEVQKLKLEMYRMLKGR